MSGSFQGSDFIVETTRGKHYFLVFDGSALFVQKSFGFKATKVMINNISDHYLEYSFDGTTVHGGLDSGENITETTKGVPDVFVRLSGVGGINTIRLQAK